VSQDAQPTLNPKKKKEGLFLPLLATDDNCVACFNGVQMTTSAGVVTVPSLKTSSIS
jgi:hypothetical protein